MSLQVRPDTSVPEETVQIARAAFPGGNPYLTLREELGVIYTDDSFSALFAHRGRPAEAPGCLAMVTLLQFAEGLSDRQAADAVRGRIDWKYLLGLDLTDPGFDFSVLSEFRGRLVAGGLEEQLLSQLLTRFKARGVLKHRGRQRTDSTHVLAAVRALNRLECVGETLRYTLNALSEVAPQWVQAHVPVEWYERYKARFEHYRLPKSQTERQAFGLTVGMDGHLLLSTVYAADCPRAVRVHPAVEVLRQVWVQQYYIQGEKVLFRDAQSLPPSERLIRSPYDLEARFSCKRQTEWTGYKVHLTETCDEDQPHLITHVATTPATTPDGQMTDVIHRALEKEALLPCEHLLDSAYLDAQHIVHSREECGIELVGPVLGDTSWQARAQEGFDVSCFAIDWEGQKVTCPQGKSSRIWSESHDAFDNPVIHVRFSKADCQACCCREKCTRGKGPRTLHLRSQPQHDALQQARQQQTSSEFLQRYKARAGIEATLSQGTRAFGMRRTRYLGLAKTHLQHLVIAAAVNLARYVAWVTETPIAKTRTSTFATLAPAA